MNRTLIIFAREPVAGRTKTRLCPPLDGAAAARLYAGFLADVLENGRSVPGTRLRIAHTPESDAAWFARFAPGIAAGPQRGATLGERMAAAFGEAFHDDHRPPTTDNYDPTRVVGGQSSVVIIGSDSPDLPPDYLHEAFAQLERGADVVLGPTDDGGYYLIGLRAPQPRLVCEVPMSTPTVLADTMALAEELGLRTELLPPWYDVDTAAELARLAANLCDASIDVAPRTRAALAEVAW